MFTLPEKPPLAIVLIVNVAVLPALTVIVETEGIIVKSGALTVTLNGAEAPAGGGSIT